MKTFTSKNQKLGKLGEDIVCKYLTRNGYKIVEKNHTKKWGEIDIVAAKDEILHFVEVKSVSRELGPNVLDVSGRHILDEHRPEDLVHTAKRRRISRTIQSYLAGVGDVEWQFDVACIAIDAAKRRARIKMLPDIIL